MRLPDCPTACASLFMISPVFGIFTKRERKLKKEQVEEIFRKNLDTELIDELPRLFAEDLNASIAQV
jgi:hypothetical protein